MAVRKKNQTSDLFVAIGAFMERGSERVYLPSDSDGEREGGSRA